MCIYTYVYIYIYVNVGQSVGRVGSGRSTCYPISPSWPCNFDVPTPQLPHSTGTQTHSYPTRQLPHSLGPNAFSIHQVRRPY